MNYGNIKFYDISNGPGVRTSLFVSGCTHHCHNCFNPETWDFSYGSSFTEDIAKSIIDSCSDTFITGISILGGEPMEPNNQRALLPFLADFRKTHSQKTIWCYSGYTFEQLTGKTASGCRCEVTDDILNVLDVLVDGKYVDSLRNISLRFRGSSNQRIIDVKASLAADEVILWHDDPVFEEHFIR